MLAIERAAAVMLLEVILKLAQAWNMQDLIFQVLLDTT